MAWGKVRARRRDTCSRVTESAGKFRRKRYTHARNIQSGAIVLQSLAFEKISSTSRQTESISLSYVYWGLFHSGDRWFSDGRRRGRFGSFWFIDILWLYTPAVDFNHNAEACILLLSERLGTLTYFSFLRGRIYFRFVIYLQCHYSRC